MNLPVSEADIERVIDAALAEDIGSGDVTSKTVLTSDSYMKLIMRSR